MLRGKSLLSLRLYSIPSTRLLSDASKLITPHEATTIVAEMIKVAIDKVFMMKLFAKTKAIMVPIK